MEMRTNSEATDNVNLTFSIRKFKRKEKLKSVRNSGCNEFSHSSQLDEFTSQTTCLFP